MLKLFSFFVKTHINKWDTDLARLNLHIKNFKSFISSFLITCLEALSALNPLFHPQYLHVFVF